MGMLPAAIAIARHHAARADAVDSKGHKRVISRHEPHSPELRARLAEIECEHACRRLDRQLRQSRIMLVSLIAFLMIIAACVITKIT